MVELCLLGIGGVGTDEQREWLGTVELVQGSSCGVDTVELYQVGNSGVDTFELCYGRSGGSAQQWCEQCGIVLSREWQCGHRRFVLNMEGWYGHC